MPDGHPSLARHRRLQQLFDEAVLLQASARESYLRNACEGDDSLLEHAWRLLAIHDKGLSFLEHPLDPAEVLGAEVPFSGTDRFTDVRRLGAGGMGVVYEARDVLRDEVVALKTLRRSGAADVYRLKREFRSLAGATHRNLVCLYELFVDEQQAFFTMELVRGQSFVTHARDRLDAGAEAGDERLRGAFVQLVDAVGALHRQGILHRDIKPSNVLVTSDGRVVVLDFGLAAERRVEWDDTTLHVTGGTPAYMAPEEATGGAPSEAGDWYGVGVTLYEALTGRLPFHGDIGEVLRRKTTSDPVPPSDLVSGIPRDLDQVCMGLLRRDPHERLTGVSALRVLDRDDNPAAIAMVDSTFVGRHAELATLARASAAVAAGGAAIVVVHGTSGIGKSALVRHFLSQHRQLLVLAGRCYENESVPHKALDGIVDALSRHLATLSDEDLEPLLPADLWALSRMFPVLRQVQAVTGPALRPSPESLDPLRVRRLALAALRTLLDRLAARQPLVVWIDDLQWADADSAQLLDEVLSPASPRGLLTLVCFRREEVAAKPFLQSWLDRLDRPEHIALPVDPLADADAHAVLTRLISRTASLSEDDARRMTREASGSPFVLEQLAFYATAAERKEAASVAHVFEWRFGALPDSARAFLDVLAVCSRPMAADIVCDAAGVTRDRQSLVAALRASHFIRSSGSSAQVEAYHDRIREALIARLDARVTRDIHGRLAASLVARQHDDPEALFEHYRGAGETEQAAVQAGRAAERASSALAFDRAASLYAEALAHAPSPSQAEAWKEGLATSLANAGRPAEAGEAFVRAAATAERARAMELERRAAEQFLTGGHIDRGLALMRRGLQNVGLRFPGSPRVSLAWLLWRRAKQSWRGLGFVARQADAIDVATLERLDACWSAATRLALVDVVGGSNFIAWHLQMALDAGEPERIVRGAALESSARTADWIYRRSAAPLAQLAGRLVESVGTPQARGMTLLAESVSCTATGRWRRALELGEQALAILRDECVGATWEVNIAQNMVIWGLMYTGEIGEVSRRVPALLAEGRSRGNLYLATELCTRSNFVWLAADDPDEGLREAEAAIAPWSRDGFYRQHFSAMLARVQTALYRGDGVTAWQLFDRDAARVRAAMLLRVQVFRIEAWYLRGRCALAIASSGASPRSWLSVARSCARYIRREQMPWSTPIAGLLTAAVAHLEGRHAEALDALTVAVEQFDRAEMQLYAAVARIRLGELRADADGEAIRQQALTWMASQQIRNPAAFTRMFAPGFDTTDVS